MAVTATADTEEKVTWTERKVLDLLRQRHAAKGGNGPEYAYMEHVKDLAGINAKRTADALALHLWQSRGHELHGFEVKISRSDWRRERDDPAKADVWCSVVDRWWIVAPAGVVPVDELPATWGLLEAFEGKLKIKVQAPQLRPIAERPLFDRSMLAPLLRAAGAGLSQTPAAAAEQAAYDRGHEAGRKAQIRTSSDWQRLYERVQPDLEEARRVQREIQMALGVSFHDWREREGHDRVREVADALRTVLREKDAGFRAKQRIEQAAARLEEQARYLREGRT